MDFVNMIQHWFIEGNPKIKIKEPQTMIKPNLNYKPKKDYSCIRFASKLRESDKAFLIILNPENQEECLWVSKKFSELKETDGIVYIPSWLMTKILEDETKDFVKNYIL